MRCLPISAVTLVLALGGVTGCSSDSESSYCDTLKQEQKAFTKLADQAETNNASYLSDTLALFKRFQQASPATLRDEWDTVVFAFSDLVDALNDAGVDPEEFNPKQRPDGVSKEDFAIVKDVAAKLSSARVLDAVAGISDQAREACKVDLPL